MPLYETLDTKPKFNPPTGTHTVWMFGKNIHVFTKHQCITMMREYEDKSFEELRLECNTLDKKHGATAMKSAVSISHKEQDLKPLDTAAAWNSSRVNSFAVSNPSATFAVSNLSTTFAVSNPSSTFTSTLFENSKHLNTFAALNPSTAFVFSNSSNLSEHSKPLSTFSYLNPAIASAVSNPESTLPPSNPSTVFTFSKSSTLFEDSEPSVTFAISNPTSISTISNPITTLTVSNSSSRFNALKHSAVFTNSSSLFENSQRLNNFAALSSTTFAASKPSITSKPSFAFSNSTLFEDPKPLNTFAASDPSTAFVFSNSSTLFQNSKPLNKLAALNSSTTFAASKPSTISKPSFVFSNPPTLFDQLDSQPLKKFSGFNPATTSAVSNPITTFAISNFSSTFAVSNPSTSFSFSNSSTLLEDSGPLIQFSDFNSATTSTISNPITTSAVLKPSKRFVASNPSSTFAVSNSFSNSITDEPHFRASRFTGAEERKNLKTENPFDVCPECNNRVPKHQLVSHKQSCDKNFKKQCPYCEEEICFVSQEHHLENLCDVYQQFSLNDYQYSSNSDDDDLESAGSLPKCIICLTMERDVVFVPCGHLVTCKNCADALEAKCPLCRKRVREKIKTFIN